MHFLMTKAGKKAGLATSYALLACTSVSAISDIIDLLDDRKHPEVLDMGVQEVPITFKVRLLKLQRALVSNGFRSRGNPTSTDSIWKKMTSGMREAKLHQERAYVVGIGILMIIYALLVPAMLIVSNERTIAANAHLLNNIGGGDTWTLGQVRKRPVCLS